LVLKENLKIEYNDDSFEQKKYENTIKNNFASSMIEKLIMKLKDGLPPTFILTKLKPSCLM